jgi:hypothetical protein
LSQELGFSFLFGLGVCLINGHLSKRSHAAEIYAIWYVFSFVFIIRLGVDIAAWLNDHSSLHIFLESAFGIPRKYTLLLHDWLTSVWDEVILITVVVVIAILPQLLAYVLAGLSGSARTPTAVLYFEKFAAWSLIKFLAGLSAILTEEAISPTNLFGRLSARSPTIVDIPDVLFKATLALFVAFSFAVFQTMFEQAATTGFPICHRVHRFFTRRLSK